MCEPPWIETARERVLGLRSGAAPDILWPNRPAPDVEPDRRAEWLARLAEAFPPGGAGEPAQDWAGVSRRLAGATAGEHRIPTAPSRVRALGMLAAGVADGWLPLLVVDLTTGEAWRATLWCRGDRVVRW
jgi:hypothetical protein